MNIAKVVLSDYVLMSWR